MSAKSYSRLHANAVEEQTAYRTAVARVLLNIQQDYGCTLQDIAEAIDVSLGTISNAANKKCDLNPIYQQRLGKVFGPAMLDPLARLYGGRVTASDAAERDALPSLAATVHRIAIARSPDSPGGVAETHCELLAMMPDLRAAQAAIGAMIARGERLAA
jgi:transcriptional regulator with XRE-family HTH domain